MAASIGFPVAMKVISSQAIHKTEAGGVLLGITSRRQVAAGFQQIQIKLEQYAPGARLDGVRIVAMADTGHDLFIGGLQDPSFGPVLFFGSGGILIEVLQDVERVLCPSSAGEIQQKLQRLKAWHLLSGIRGQVAIDPTPLIVITSYSIHYTKLYESHRKRCRWHNGSSTTSSSPMPSFSWGITSVMARQTPARWMKSIILNPQPPAPPR